MFSIGNKISHPMHGAGVVTDIVERTIDMGYRGVAITDHNGCQAFPISFGIEPFNSL